MADSCGLEPRRATALADAFADWPDTYPEAVAQLKELSDEFRHQAAKKLEPHLNALIAARTLTRIDDFAELARMVDETTRNLGLCVTADGRPGVPCAVHPEGPSSTKGAFAVIVHGPNPKRPINLPLEGEPPRFTLEAAPYNVETYLRPLRDALYRDRRTR